MVLNNKMAKMTEKERILEQGLLYRCTKYSESCDNKKGPPFTTTARKDMIIPPIFKQPSVYPDHFQPIAGMLSKNFQLVFSVAFTSIVPLEVSSIFSSS